MPALAALRDHLARRWAWWLGFVLGLWVLGPGVWRPTTHFIGTEYIDTHGTLWFFWWVEEALRTGQALRSRSAPKSPANPRTKRTGSYPTIARVMRTTDSSRKR